MNVVTSYCTDCLSISQRAKRLQEAPLFLYPRLGAFPRLGVFPSLLTVCRMNSRRSTL